jgi:hypothetical protein
MVCTISGIANDVIVNKKNAMVVRHKNSTDIYEAISELTNNSGLKNDIIKEGHINVQSFSFESKFEKLKQLYLS